MLLIGRGGGKGIAKHHFTLLLGRGFVATSTTSGIGFENGGLLRNKFLMNITQGI
jgi:hypothetical protein